MPRLTPITERGQVEPGGEDAFDRVIASRGRVNAPVSMLLYVPEVGAISTAMSDAVRFGAQVLSDGDVELGILTACREFDIPYIWGQHVERAVSLGVDRAVIDALSRLQPIPPTSLRHTLIPRFGHALLTEHLVPQSLFDEMTAELGERGLMELVALFGHVLTGGCALITADYDPEPGAPILPPRASLR
jgi:hypothetical protein